MQVSEILNLVALVVVPVVAVLVGQYLQTQSKKRDDRKRIFEEIMASRIFGLSAETVRAYNMIHLVFASERKIRENGVSTTALFVLKTQIGSTWPFASGSSLNC